MTTPPRPRPATDARPRNPARPVAGRSRRARPAPVREPGAPARAHAAAEPGDARARRPGAGKRPPSTPPAEPAQEQGATLPRVERESATMIKVVDGLRGVVSRWECSATVLGSLASFTRLDGAPARAHPVTVERHWGCAVEWVRGRVQR